MLDIGVALPNTGRESSPDAIADAARAAADLGWHSVWVTDHLLIDRAESTRYGRVFEALTTLAWLGSQVDRLRLGTSVLVVPQRNAVVLAKEIATLDALVAGRLVVGVGAGWSEPEFANVGAQDRFRVRGRYLDEAILLWRHLWSGSDTPFEGRFHTVRDSVLAPLPVQGAALPIVIGGGSDRAVERAARLGDGYQVTQMGPDDLSRRAARLRTLVAQAERPMPRLEARLVVHFGGDQARANALAGTVRQMRQRLDAWVIAGAAELVLKFEDATPRDNVRSMERFDRDVLRPSRT